MSTTIIRPKDRNEWLDYRRAGIGSSEIATIVGLNPYETPYQLWRRKIGLDEPKSETFAMKAGHYLEDAVSQFWSDATGRQIIKASAGDWIVRNDEKPFVQVSPDRTYWLDDNRNNDNNAYFFHIRSSYHRKAVHALRPSSDNSITHPISSGKKFDMCANPISSGR